METKPCAIIEYFNGTKQMMVPLFQRPYEWEKKNWETLWSDLLERYERADTDSNATHFTGAIVTAPAKSVPIGVSKHLVIDGQQRLTTVAILLCAIRSHFEPDTPRFRKLTRLLVNEDDVGLDHLKLLPTQPDREAFTALISGTMPAGTRFATAFDFFRKQLATPDSEGNPIDLQKLLEVLQSQLIVVSIHLAENDDPYLIFESLNAKGAPLTQADLIRNYLLLRLHAQSQQTAYEAHWLPMQSLLPSDDLTEFMRTYLMLSGEEVVKASIYSVLKARLSSVADNQILAELTKIHRAARFYAVIIGISQDHSPEIEEALHRMRRWEIGVANPLLLRLLLARDDGHLSSTELSKILHTIESFAVRRWVCGVPTNQLKRIFLSLTRDLPLKNASDELVKSLANGTLGRRWPKDDEFETAWLAHRAYVPPLGRCRLMLEVLESSLGHKETIDFEKLTIEHVMPQTLSPEWKSSLGPGASQIHERWCDTFGNLTLTAYNSELSNLPFEKKRKQLDQSNLEHNRRIAKNTKWRADEIETRGKAMYEQARTIWPRPE